MILATLIGWIEGRIDLDGLNNRIIVDGLLNKNQSFDDMLDPSY